MNTININKDCVKSFIISAIVLLITIVQIVLSIILFAKIKSLKERPEKQTDIIISGFKSFNFTEFSLEPTYEPSKGNLGIRLILDCYSGICHKT